MKHLAHAVGAASLVGSLATMALGACTCGPAPTPPSTDTCSSAPGLTATSVRLFRHGGDELVDGSPLPIFFGAQGGQHWGFDVLVAAEGASDCVEVQLELRAVPGTRMVGSFSGGVRSHITSDGVLTSQIVVFPSGGAFERSVVATVSAYGATRTVVLCADGFDCARDGGLGDAP